MNRITLKIIILTGRTTVERGTSSLGERKSFPKNYLLLNLFSSNKEESITAKITYTYFDDLSAPIFNFIFSIFSPV